MFDPPMSKHGEDQQGATNLDLVSLPFLYLGYVDIFC
jgi:hypothetical protein